MAKKGAGSTQWDILIRSGIPEAEVPKFRWGPDSTKLILQLGGGRVLLVWQNYPAGAGVPCEWVVGRPGMLEGTVWTCQMEPCAQLCHVSA